MRAKSPIARDSGTCRLLLAAAALVVMGPTSCRQPTAPAPAPAPPLPPPPVAAGAVASEAPGWFQVPEGWQIVTTSATSTRLAPTSGPADSWISVIGPMRYAGRSGDLSFEQWFSMLQEPGASRGSELERGKDGAGRDTLFQVLINDEEFPPYRAYRGVRDSNRAVVIILLAPTAETAEAALPALDGLAASLRWDAAPSP